jgi:hypothetical protein
MCDDCWSDEHGQRVPIRLLCPQIETCCICGKEANGGIYVRRSPVTVPYPTYDGDDD